MMAEFESKPNVTLCLSIAFFCISLNCTGSLLFHDASYGILYLDMVGTMIGAIVLGPAWSVLVGVITNALSSIFLDRSFLCFAVVNVFGALYWGWLAQAGLLSMPLSSDGKGRYRITYSWALKVGVLQSGIVAGILTSIPASILQRWLFDYGTPSSSSYLTKYSKQNVGMFITLKDLLGDYVCDLFIDFGLSIPDKLLTSLLAIMFCITLLRYYSGRLTGGQFEAGRPRGALRVLFQQDPLPCLASLVIYVLGFLFLPHDLQHKILSNGKLLVTIVIPLLYCLAVLGYSRFGSRASGGNSIYLVGLDEMSKMPKLKDQVAFAFTLGTALAVICTFYWFLIDRVFATGLKQIYFEQVVKLTSVKDVIDNANFWKFALPPCLLLVSYVVLEDRNSRALVELKEQAQARLVRWFYHDIKDRVYRVNSFLKHLGGFLERNRLGEEPLQERYHEGQKSKPIGEAYLQCRSEALRFESNIKVLKHMLSKSGDEPSNADVAQIIHDAALPFLRKFAVEVNAGLSGESTVYADYLFCCVDNLLRNAEKHAFYSRPGSDAKVVFNIGSADRFLVIDYMNNGAPLPAGFSKAKFFEYEKKLSSSSNEGLGGAFIGFIVEDLHKGLFEIVSNPEYNVHFRIHLSKEI
jgi:hypothetical protein